MKPKILAKILVDLTMMVLLLFQMGYHLWGERNHEWTGAFLFLLFVIHQILNRQWYKNLPWGKYGLMRVLTLMVDLLVLAAMAAQLYSGVVLSRYIFRFLPIHRGMALARRLHILGAGGTCLSARTWGSTGGCCWGLPKGIARQGKALPLPRCCSWPGCWRQATAPLSSKNGTWRTICSCGLSLFFWIMRSQGCCSFWTIWRLWRCVFS